jgi:hypothetical protein
VNRVLPLWLAVLIIGGLVLAGALGFQMAIWRYYTRWTRPKYLLRLRNVTFLIGASIAGLAFILALVTLVLS